MNITAAKQQVKDTVEAYLKRDDAGLYVIPPVHQRPVFLVGAPGIGKTAIMEQVARELGIGIVSYSMTHHTRQSALGLPRIEHRSFEGTEFEASEYTMSEIVAAIYDYMERTGLRQGLLFLDEINCVSETLYPSMLQFLQFKTFGKHKVPEGWVIVCAGNPPEYNRSVHEFDIVTLDRLREIDVEPDYGAWKTYASEVGIHPAVTSFLEAKKESFYKVESRPGGGKSFVTARGWEDLAEVISLYEKLEKPVNRDLFVQFLRDDEIADQFSVYYSLFEKYRSDYQVGAILAGEASDAIKQRAQAAKFDEHLALLSLILDSLSSDCNKALDQEGIALELRDVLREAKPAFLKGASAEEALGTRIAERERKLGRKIESGTASNAYIRKERLVNSLLRGFEAQCAMEKSLDGDAAFHTIERAYKAEVAKIKPLANEASGRMDNAFAFVDECMGSREMLVFVAELTTRKTTTQFIAHYGNEQYYAHNNELQVDAARMGLTDRVNQLGEIDSVGSIVDNADVASVGNGAGTAAGLRTGGASEAGEAGEGIEGAAASDDAAAEMTPDTAGASVGIRLSSKPQGQANVVGAAPGTASGASPSTAAAPSMAAAPSVEQLRAHYSGKQFEYGFASICKMNLPTGLLKGKKVLDICCRRGRGVYKISSMVGAEGLAIGVDWSQAFVEEAKDGMTRAWHDSGLKANNMSFSLAYPENLITAGLGNSSMDVVYVNNVMTLFYDQGQALREFARVLKPGGLLVMETVLASEKRDDATIDAARAIGNSIQAARTQEENMAWLEAAGFDEPALEGEYEVRADQGFKADYEVPVVADDSGVDYRAVTWYVRKK